MPFDSWINTRFTRAPANSENTKIQALFLEPSPDLPQLHVEFSNGDKVDASLDSKQRVKVFGICLPPIRLPHEELRSHLSGRRFLS